MKIFDKKTNVEILPKMKSRTSGTDRVIERFLEVRGGDIENIVFGRTSKGYISGESLPRNIVFKNCIFRRVVFSSMSDCTFTNCVFDKCTFYDTANIIMVNCDGFETYMYNENKNMLSGICGFDSCSGIIFAGELAPNIDLTVNDTPELTALLDRIEEKKRLAEEARLKNLELRKSVKYGYKVVSNAKVLVKLSFPEDVDLVNLDKDKSRASGAMVESIHVINDFGTEGVINNAYNRTEYKVGEMVYPDTFDPNPNQDCGHGIHFCKDVDCLAEYGSLSDAQIQSIKDQNLL